MAVRKQINFFEKAGLLKTQKTSRRSSERNHDPNPENNDEDVAMLYEADGNCAVVEDDTNDFADSTNAFAGLDDAYQSLMMSILDSCDSRPDDGDNQTPLRDKTTPQLIEQLIKYEEDYVAELWMLVKSYLPEIRRRAKKSKNKFPLLFENIEQLYLEANRFLQLLKQNQEDAEEILLLFSESKLLFDSNVQYIRNKVSGDRFFAQLRKEISDISKELNDTKTFDSHLMSPLRQLGNYIFVLKKIENNFRDAAMDTSSIDAARHVIIQTIHRASDLMVIDTIENSKLDLQKEGSFIKKSVFNITGLKKDAKYTVFLFENVIVFTQNKAYDQYSYVDSIKLVDVSVANYIKDSLDFHLTNYLKFKETNSLEKATFVLQATTLTIKNQWINIIQALLKQNLDKTRNSR